MRTTPERHSKLAAKFAGPYLGLRATNAPRPDAVTDDESPLDRNDSGTKISATLDYRQRLRSGVIHRTTQKSAFRLFRGVTASSNPPGQHSMVTPFGAVSPGACPPKREPGLWRATDLKDTVGRWPVLGEGLGRFWSLGAESHSPRCLRKQTRWWSAWG
ncbi:hypothetical protein GWK47_045925 [Chionoecetes opilio]|uniref:Uncharacterized protein n=1 Tax=Chionoecetes opilio TaxID=41210 RepID=A0A8J4Y6P6_CHIOP|nr:hypothetical protein GWK47_045925 [Chionoecetes opilio]